MPCPYCQSAATTECPDTTELGYRRFRCRACKRIFNERTATAFNRLSYPTDVICLVILWRFWYKLSLRDLAEMFLQWGMIFRHEAVWEWEHKLTLFLSDALRQRRHGAVWQSWYVDETYRYSLLKITVSVSRHATFDCQDTRPPQRSNRRTNRRSTRGCSRESK
jgi:hypothetical protein